jgi:hypothetical protein
MRRQQKAIVAQKKLEREARLAESRSQSAEEKKIESFEDSKLEERKVNEALRRREMMSLALASRLKVPISEYFLFF